MLPACGWPSPRLGLTDPMLVDHPPGERLLCAPELRNVPDTPVRFDVRQHGRTQRRDEKGRDDRSIRRRSTRTKLRHLSGVRRLPATGGRIGALRCTWALAMIDIPHLDDNPYLPDVGEIYWVDSAIIHPKDKKPDRPVLVVEVPATLSGRITIVTRTTNEERTPGVPSPPDPDLGLNKPGVWGYLRSAEANLWTPSMVEYRGPVELAVLLAVREVFGL